MPQNLLLAGIAGPSAQLQSFVKTRPFHDVGHSILASQIIHIQRFKNGEERFPSHFCMTVKLHSHIDEFLLSRIALQTETLMDFQKRFFKRRDASHDFCVGVNDVRILTNPTQGCHEKSRTPPLLAYRLRNFPLKEGVYGIFHRHLLSANQILHPVERRTVFEPARRCPQLLAWTSRGFLSGETP